MTALRGLAVAALILGASYVLTQWILIAAMMVIFAGLAVGGP